MTGSSSSIAYPRSQCWLSYTIRDQRGTTITDSTALWFTSEKPKVKQSRWYESKPEPTASPRAGEYLHKNDAEVKAVDYLANAIVDQWPAAGTEDQAEWQRFAQNLEGQVYLGCSQGPCHSCRWVIRQISKDISEVPFIVSYTARDVYRSTSLKEGTKVSLYGEYGYQMASLSEIGTAWGVRVLAGVEKGFVIPKKDYPKDPPGGEPAEKFDEGVLL
jgi:hypothetical protein